MGLVCCAAEDRQQYKTAFLSTILGKDKTDKLE